MAKAAVAAGTIEPCLIVFPDGYGDSFWADSVNSAKPAETNVKLEIIPHVDANYRTIASRHRRAVQGFSMGGFGAAKFAAKFPETFGACVIYDGAMLNWTQVQQRHPAQATEIFNNSGAAFDLHSPWYWLAQNAATLRATMPFRDAVGALVNENRAWRDALLAQSIAPSYVETGLAHSLSPLLDAQGSNSWAFIAQAFAAMSEEPLTALTIFAQGNHALLKWPSRTNEIFQVEHCTNLQLLAWQALSTNLPAAPGTFTEYTHSNALLAAAGFYRVQVSTSAPPATNFSFTFTWSGTNFTYTDSNRTFTGVMLKPPGNGPFAGVVISHGAGGTANGYSLPKAREMVDWGVVGIGPTLTHAAGGETNPVNMGNCPENNARVVACANVLASLAYVDTNRLALFGHSMGAFNTIGSAGVLAGRLRAAAIAAGGVIPSGTSNATPTYAEANPVRAPFLMFHCDADPVVPPSRSLAFQQILISNAVLNSRIIYSSNSLAQAQWHNLHQNATINADLLTNTFQWFQTHGVLPGP